MTDTPDPGVTPEPVQPMEPAFPETSPGSQPVEAPEAPSFPDDGKPYDGALLPRYSRGE